MRVIAGVARGRRLKRVSGSVTRPTKDRVKEAMFSSIGAKVEGASVLDLFAGSGALGIEALSRGARKAVFVESSSRALRVIKDNLEACGLSGRAEVFDGPVERFIEVPGDPFDLILIDPPYDAGLPFDVLESLVTKGFLAGEGLVVCEVATSRAGADVPQMLEIRSHKKYGDTTLIYLVEAS